MRSNYTSDVDGLDLLRGEGGEGGCDVDHLQKINKKWKTKKKMK